MVARRRIDRSGDMLTALEGTSEFSGTSRFRIRRRLGAGGMGVVYEALDAELDHPVALKTLSSATAHSIYLLKQEFRTLAGLEHPNLVRLGELMESAGTWFFTMELIHGVDFLAWVRPRAADLDPGTFAAHCDEQRLRPALAQVASGLVALHRAGLVHRDVKPSNILVTGKGRAVLLDMGLARSTRDEMTSGGNQVAGTPAYMAPEQAVTETVGPAADWYGLGTLLYQAMTGRLPFTGQPLQVIMDKQQQEPPPPSAWVPDVPPDLDALCVDLLRHDPALRPDAAEILSRLGVVPLARAPALVTITQSTPFVGRAVELAQLRDGFDATDGGWVSMLVWGESGVGKSALIRQFTETLRVERADAVVLAGRCYERESVPYQGFDSLIDALSRHLRRLSDRELVGLLPRQVGLLPRVFPVLGRVEAIARAPARELAGGDPHELRRRVFAALRELLGAIAERQPLVLCIDDFQWADADSRALLSDLGRAPHAPSLLLLLSARSPQPDLPGQVRELRLDTLGRADALTLANLLLERAHLNDPGAGVDLAVEARGHPLYIDELVRHLAGSRTPARRLRLDDAIRARTADLPADARRLLRLVCLAGAPLPQEIVAAAAQLPTGEFHGHVATLRSGNLVRTGGNRPDDPIEPYHGRVREAIIAEVGDERAEHHRRLAIALQTSTLGTGRPELLVAHLQAAGDGDRAAEHAERAAERARAALAFDRAAQLYGTALELGGTDPAKRRELERARAQSLAHAGRGAEAAAAFQAAAEGAEPAVRLECQRQAAEQWLISGHLEQGRGALAGLLAEIGGKLPSSRRAIASLVWHRLGHRLRGVRWKPRPESSVAPEDLVRIDVYRSAVHGLSMIDPVLGAYFNARCLRAALRCGETTRVARLLFLEAIHEAYEGGAGLARARALWQKGSAPAEAATDPYLAAWVAATDGIVGYLEGRFSFAADRLVAAEAQFREVPSVAVWETTSVRLFRLWALRFMGRIGDLIDLRDEAIADADRRGDRYLGSSARRFATITWVARGNPDGALADLAAATWTPPEPAFHIQHWFDLEARGEHALATGTAAEAMARLGPAYRRFERSLLRRGQVLRCNAAWVKARLLLAAGGDGAAEAAGVARRLRRERIGYAGLYAHLVGAGCAARAGDPDAAVAALTAAEETARALEMPIFEQVARLRRGQLLGGSAGAELISGAEAWMRGQSIQDPAAMAEIHAPGFADR